MKTKQLVIFGGILAFLVIAVVIKQQQRPVELVKSEYVSLDFSFNQEDVGQIDITRYRKPVEEDTAEDAATTQAEQEFVELVKSGDQWKVKTRWDALGDSKKVDELLEEVLKTKGELRGDDKELFSDFGIADDDSYKVTIADGQGKSLLTFRLGTLKANFQNVFIRKEGSAQVFLASSNLFGKLGIYGDPAKDSLTQDYWVDMTLAHFDKDKVTSLEIREFKDTEGYVTASVEKIKDADNPEQVKWRYTSEGNPFPIDASKVKSFLSTLSSVRTGRVIDPTSEEADLGSPSLQVLVGFEDAEDIVILVAQQHPESKGYPTQVTGQAAPFSLSEYYYNLIKIDDSQFFVTNPLRVDVEKAEKLAVSSKSGKYDLKPMEDKSSGITNYLNDLKALNIKRLIFDPTEIKKVKSPSKYFIEFQAEGQESSVILDVGFNALDEEAKEYAAKLRDHDQAFVIEQAHFKKLLEDTDRLKVEMPSQA